MDEDHPVDFSALDPKRDPIRFERRVQAIVAGARPRPASPLLLGLVGWGRAAVTAAALLAVAAWLPSMLRGGSRTSEARGSDPIDLVSTWAETGQVPSDVDLFQALGSGDGN
ncbi:hypothetical protein P2318_17535 [Myxococcaceae bacterium GXIMD 01537]